MKKIFLDCGFYDGVVFNLYQLDDSWEIHTWEPEPDFDFGSRLDRLKVKPRIHKQAVWDKNTNVLFKRGILSSSSYVAETRREEDGEPVRAINFSNFVAKLPTAWIICSMDIEGSEYRVLEKMLKDNTIDRIHVLDVEFHHRFMPYHNTQDSENLVKRIQERGTLVRLKVPFES